MDDMDSVITIKKESKNLAIIDKTVLAMKELSIHAKAVYAAIEAFDITDSENLYTYFDESPSVIDCALGELCSKAIIRNK